MKKLMKNKIFWLFLAAVIVTAFFVLKGKNAPAEEYTTETVKQGDLVQTVSSTGKVESASETDLNFKIGGQLRSIYVKAGAVVKAGQLLASLSAAQALSAANAAKAAVMQAEADLKSVKAGARVEDLAVYKAKVDQARADLAAKQNLLEQIKKEVAENTLSIKEQAIDKTWETVFLGKKALEDIDKIINNASYQDQLKIYTFSYQETSIAFDSAWLALIDLEKFTPAYTVASSQAELVELMEAVGNFLFALDSALNKTFILLTKVAAGGAISQTQLDAFKSDINIDQTNTAAKIVAVQTAKANLQTKDAEYQKSLASAQSDVVKAEAALKVAEAELTLKQAGPLDYQVSLSEAKLAQAMANWQKALADLADYSLFAPLDGLISKINFSKGEYVGTGAAMISEIGISNLEIKVDVPEADIAKIKTGQTATVTLDAFTDNREFRGRVTFVDPAETIINDVVYYKVTVSFEQKEEDVKSGMTANVTILTNARKNVLFIPARAILEKNNSRFVRILTDNVKKEKEVTTGLRADEGLIEILSGLEEGETIITFIKEKK